MKKMKHKNKTFNSILLDNYLQCLEQNESQDLKRQLDTSPIFKTNFAQLLSAFNLAHDFLYERNYYLTDSIDAYNINPEDPEKVYPMYIYDDLLVYTMNDYGIETLLIRNTIENVVQDLQAFAKNTINYDHM